VSPHFRLRINPHASLIAESGTAKSLRLAFEVKNSEFDPRHGANMKLIRMIAIGLIGLAITACGRTDPPADPLKGQRDALNKARGVEGVLQKQADDQRNAADEAQK
jgi:hypothetical protein